jgi:predicted DNA-binding transcriptional regulator YafY
MSRNDQVTRQWFLLQSLESPKGATLQELAAALPEDLTCHPRTIRRDLEALELRFPLITEQVNGRTRWRLMDGYRQTLPLSFSATELMALIYSRDLLKPLDGTQFRTSLDSAFNKAAAALPSEGLAYIKQMQGYFSVGLGPHKTYRAHHHTIGKLTRAIEQTRTVQMCYYSASRDATSRREVDPYRLWYANGALYLVAYCRTRRDVRLFSVDRIQSLTITNHPCQMLVGFDLESYIQDALIIMRGQAIELELRFDRATSAWVKDRQWHPSQQMATGKDGRLTMTLQVAETRELLGWVLSFGSGVRVIRPASLRESMREEAKKILQRE